MPDAPPAPPKADTVVAEPVMTQQQALRQVGWVQPVDFIIIGLVSLTWITLLYWGIFGAPTPMQIMACCLVAFALVQLWVVILLYRCSHFVLMLTAYVNNMPDAAARMVIGYYSGRPMPQQPPAKK
jgi:hypothetical protein